MHLFLTKTPWLTKEHVGHGRLHTPEADKEGSRTDKREIGGQVLLHLRYLF